LRCFIKRIYNLFKKGSRWGVKMDLGGAMWSSAGKSVPCFSINFTFFPQISGRSWKFLDCQCDDRILFFALLPKNVFHKILGIGNGFYKTSSLQILPVFLLFLYVFWLHGFLRYGILICNFTADTVMRNSRFRIF